MVNRLQRIGSYFLGSHKTIVKRLLALSLLLWVTISVFFARDYIDFSSIKEVTKGGTFVEGIYQPISYLPYRGDITTNQFYQTLLFPGCLGGIDGDLCEVTTDDNKTYRVTTLYTGTRSDGAPFTLEDVEYTYHNIVVNNMRSHVYLAPYQNLSITVDEEDPTVLVVTFPVASQDNRAFFELPILPTHRVIELPEVEDYVAQFGPNPVTIGCAGLQSSKDKNSLLIDLKNCTKTNINLYQIKLFDTLQDLQDHLQSGKSIVSFYYGNVEQEDYRILPIQDNLFVSMFFNTKSTKLSPRIQRALAGFVNYNLWQSSHTGYMTEYKGLFSYYQSTGNNVASFIKEKNPSLTYDKVLLEQGGVKTLPRIFTVDWAKRKYAFYVDPLEAQEYTFTIETADPVTGISAKTNHSARALVINSENGNKKHTITFTVGPNQQIIEGLNTISIRGTVLGTGQEIARIDLYYLGKTSEQITQDPLKIIMLDNRTSNYIRAYLRKLFLDNSMSDLFEFIVYGSREEYLQALKDNTYDIALSTIQMRGLADIYTIFSSSQSDVNLSNYINPVLNSYLGDNNRQMVQNIMSVEQPFFILGQLMKPYWLANDIVVDLPENLSEMKLKKSLLQYISIVSRTYLDSNILFDYKNLIQYIQSLTTPMTSDSVVLPSDIVE